MHCTFGDGCSYIHFGSSSGSKSYYKAITIEPGNQYIYLNCTGTTSSSAYYQNVTVGKGVNTTTTWKTISDANTNQDYETVYQANGSLLVPVGSGGAATGQSIDTMDVRYRIYSPTLSTSGTSVSATLQDRTINVIELDSTITNVTLTFPTAYQTYARDFLIRLVITGSTVPSITFQEAGGGAVAFDTDDDSWADIQPGVNLLMFTETAQ
jgi:hypothetical protein